MPPALIGGLILGGGLLGSSLLGTFGPSGKQQRRTLESQEDINLLQAEIGRDIYETAGRPATLQLGQFIETGEAPTSLLPAFTPVREGIENQFSRARENILSSVPARGGQLNDLLAEIETSRAQAVGGLEAPLRERLFFAGLGAPGTSLQAATGASAGLGDVARQAAGIASAQGGALGSTTALAAKLALKAGGGGVNTGPLASGASEILLG